MKSSKIRRLCFNFSVIQVTLAILWVTVLKWHLLECQIKLSHASIGILLGLNSCFPTRIPAPLEWHSFFLVLSGLAGIDYHQHVVK